MQREAAFAFLLLAAASLAAAQPVGSEFRVSDVTSGYQYQPAIAHDAGGNFVVVWSSENVDGSNTAIVGRRYDAAGNPLGGAFQVNSYTPGYQVSAAVSAHPSGAFVVVWQSPSPGRTTDDVYAQRFDATGARLGAEFRVNTSYVGEEGRPRVAVGPAGDFVVTWLQYGGGLGFHMFGQRYDAAGSPVGGEFRPSGNLAGGDVPAGLLKQPGGGFVVVWERYPEAIGGSNTGIAARRFDGTGDPIGMEFAVNTYTTNDQRTASIAGDAAGNFVIVWESTEQVDPPDSFASDIYGQLFEADGDRIGGEFHVNTYTLTSQRRPSVTRDPGGEFVVTWDSVVSGYQDVFGQRFTAAGVKNGAEFRVNSFTTGTQQDSVVASTPWGGFVVGWVSYGQDGDSSGIYAQRFGDVIFRDGFED
jgi:hypothetical protein